MKVYLDASVLVALFTIDRFAAEADRLLGGQPYVVISDFAAAEFASAISRRVRMRDLTVAEAQAAFTHFDAWTAREAQRAEVTSSDIVACQMFLRRLDLPLRTADALNIAVAVRVDALLATFDKAMGEAARVLGVDVVPTS